jgi:hypothetical protein
MIYKETKTRFYEDLNPQHTAMAVYEQEYTVWYLFGFIPIMYWDSKPILVHDKYIKGLCTE